MSESGEYNLELHEGGARLSGVMRLISPSAYRAALSDVEERIGSGVAAFEFDVADLQFLNSSGITAISRLVLTARQKGTKLVFILDEEVLWQKKTLPSLARLYPGMELRKR